MADTGKRFDSMSEVKDPADVWAFWDNEIKRASKKEEDARKTMARVECLYAPDPPAPGKRVNILFSNTQILKPAIFNGVPKPDVRPRFQTKNDELNRLTRKASDILETALEYLTDVQPFVETLEDVEEDYLIVGRGIPRVRFEPILGRGEEIETRLDTEPIIGDFEQVIGENFINPENGEVVDQEEFEVQTDENGPFFMRPGDEEVVDEKVLIEYVPWDDFRQTPTRRWEDVWWVGFRSLMTRDEMDEQIVDENGKTLDVVKDIQLTEKSQDPNSGEAPCETPDNAIGDGFNRALIWEIWDKNARKMILISPGLKDRPILEEEDPLRLTDFFPIPEPLYSIKRNRNMNPLPEYTIYEDQADQLDIINTRITNLIRACVVRGVGAGFAQDELDRLFKSPDNTILTIKNWDNLAERGGISGVIDWVPLQPIAEALRILFEDKQTLVNDIFQVTGIADIFRGASNPNETLGAQRLKSQFGSLRIRPRQQEFQRMIRDLYRMMAEIIAEHFSAETLQRMAGEEGAAFEDGQEVDFEEIIQFLRDDGQRGFLIDVESDSTIAADEAQEKQDVAEMFTAAGTFFANIAPIAQSGALGPNGAEIVKQMLIFGMQKFGMGRVFEDIIETNSQQGSPNTPSPPGATGDPTGGTPEQGAGGGEAIEAAQAQAKEERESTIAEAELILKEREVEVDEGELELDALKERNRADEARLEARLKALGRG